MDKPIIGVSCNYRPHEGENGKFNLDRSYTEAIYTNGGIPQIIPILSLKEVPSIVHLYDGILLSGGGGLLPDIKKLDTLPPLQEQNPVRYAFEVQLIKCAAEKGVPMLGVCRGHQMINEIFGGTIINLPNDKHRQKSPGKFAAHKITILRDTRLYDCIHTGEVKVNSFHSQVIDQPGDGLQVTAYAEDRVIESVESISSNFIMGVQFHPEFMLKNDRMMRIYSAFINAASQFKDQKDK